MLSPTRTSTILERLPMCSLSAAYALVPFSALNHVDLVQQVGQLRAELDTLDQIDLHQLARTRLEGLDFQANMRAACVSKDVNELRRQLATLQAWADAEVAQRFDQRLGVVIARPRQSLQIGYMFPGQGSPVYRDAGIYGQLFPFVSELFKQLEHELGNQPDGTAVAQPAIALASVVGLKILALLGIKAEMALGHSLGELVALHWAEAFNQTTLLRIAKQRGQLMNHWGHPDSTMASIQADIATITRLIGTAEVTVACINAPEQVVIAGRCQNVQDVLERALDAGLKGQPLTVSHAFHSPLIAAAVQPFDAYLQTEVLGPVQRPVLSTVTGKLIQPDQSVHALLLDQITAPVRFVEAAEHLAAQVDLLIEIGPGQTLGRLASHFLSVPAVSLDACAPSFRGLLMVIGLLFSMQT